MRLLPRFLTNAGNRILGLASERYRKVVRVILVLAAVAFLAFEVSRFWIAGRDVVIPLLQIVHDQFVLMTSGSLLAAVVSLSVTALAIILPWAALIWLWSRAKRHRNSRPASG